MIQQRKVLFLLVYGRQARLPIDLDLPSELDANESPEDVLKRRCDAFIDLNCTREEAAANIRKAQKKQKRNHDKRASKTDFEIGDLVLVHNTRKTTRKGGKLEKKWNGPYEIREVMQKGTYRLNGLKNAVNGSRLKLYLIRGGFQGKSEDGNKRRKKNEEEEKKPEKKEEKPQHEFFESKSDEEQYVPKEDRRRGSYECSDSDSDTIIIGEEEDVTLINFFPITGEWQTENCDKFDLTVKNVHDSGRGRKIKITSEPTKVACMRGDGNCLFRTFSFVLSGVQSFHKTVREKIVSYMEENNDVFSRIENTPMDKYLSASKMKNPGTWGTELEIIAFASMCNTPVHVYCSAGHGEYKWLVYKPAIGQSLYNHSVYLQNIYGHFEPVLDVREEVYTRTPYMKIADYLDKRLQNYVPQDILESALVNSNIDELKVRSIEDIEPPYVITRKFTDKFCTPCKFKVDPNIFNALCDWADFDQFL